MDVLNTILIVYHSGKRKGQTIRYEGVKDDDLWEKLEDLTQDQLANAEIHIIREEKKQLYEDFVINYHKTESGNRNLN